MQRLCGIDLVRRDHPRPETSGGIEVLALSDIELGVPRPLARGPFVAERVARDVLVRFFFRDPASFAADHQRDLAFIVERCVTPGFTSDSPEPTNEPGVRKNMLGYFAASVLSLYSAWR